MKLQEISKLINYNVKNKNFWFWNIEDEYSFIISNKNIINQWCQIQFDHEPFLTNGMHADMHMYLYYYFISIFKFQNFFLIFI